MIQYVVGQHSHVVYMRKLLNDSQDMLNLCVPVLSRSQVTGVGATVSAGVDFVEPT